MEEVSDGVMTGMACAAYLCGKLQYIEVIGISCDEYHASGYATFSTVSKKGFKPFYQEIVLHVIVWMLIRKCNIC